MWFWSFTGEKSEENLEVEGIKCALTPDDELVMLLGMITTILATMWWLNKGKYCTIRNKWAMYSAVRLNPCQTRLTRSQEVIPNPRLLVCKTSIFHAVVCLIQSKKHIFQNIKTKWTAEVEMTSLAPRLLPGDADAIGPVVGHRKADGSLCFDGMDDWLGELYEGHRPRAIAGTKRWGDKGWKISTEKTIENINFEGKKTSWRLSDDIVMMIDVWIVGFERMR